MITRNGWLRLPLISFGTLLLLLTICLLAARLQPSTAYWITAVGGSEKAYGLYRLRPDGEGRVRRIVESPVITSHAWSPDGRLIAVAVDDKPNLYWYTVSGEIYAEMLVVDQDIFYLAYAPDGRQMIYTTRGQNMGFQINRIDLTHEAIAPFIQASGGAMMGAWSPDRRLLVYSSLRTDYGADIYVRDLADGPTRILTSANGADAAPEFSPDGQWIAFMSDRTGSAHLYLMRPDGSDIRPVGGKLTDERWPVWTPDGAWLIFSSIYANGIPTLYRIRPDGTGLQQISPVGVPLAVGKCSPLIDRAWHPLAHLLAAGAMWGGMMLGHPAWRWVRRRGWASG